MALYGSPRRFFPPIKTIKVKRPIQYPQLFSSKTETIQVWLCHFMANIYQLNKLSCDPYYKQPMKILNRKMVKCLNPNYKLVFGNPKFYMDNNSLMLKPKVKTKNYWNHSGSEVNTTKENYKKGLILKFLRFFNFMGHRYWTF